MIESPLTLEIINLTLEGEKFEEQISKQLNFLEETEIEHTGNGLSVYLSAQPGIEKYKLNGIQLNELFGENITELTKLELFNKELNIHADTSVHFNDGIIDCVEIWNKLGDFPEEELLTYELKRL